MPRRTDQEVREKRPAAAAAGDFAARLLGWFDRHGRHDLPWQHPRTPYRVWLAEVMLQQTQVATVIPYFARFLGRFPTLPALAAAPLDDVLALWSGLGYYARARNLHRCAQAVVERHGGELPRDFAAMVALPGLGRSTAGAILAQAYGERHAILDGNVRRVLARHDAIPGWPGAPAVQRRLWQSAEDKLPHARLADYTQALMDLGATLCTARAPRCGECPVGEDCAARRSDSVGHFPAPRPRRERPQRRAELLLIHNHRGELLLERRPPAGLWGALWSPPIVAAGEPAPAGLQQVRASAQRVSALAPIHHAFTHFDLELQPLLVAIDDVATLAGSPGQRWTTIDAAHALGLPAPVRRLLQTPDLLPCPAPSTA